MNLKEAGLNAKQYAGLLTALDSPKSGALIVRRPTGDALVRRGYAKPISTGGPSLFHYAITDEGREVLARVAAAEKPQAPTFELTESGKAKVTAHLAEKAQAEPKFGATSIVILHGKPRKIIHLPAHSGDAYGLECGPGVIWAEEAELRLPELRDYRPGTAVRRQLSELSHLNDRRTSSLALATVAAGVLAECEEQGIAAMLDEIGTWTVEYVAEARANRD